MGSEQGGAQVRSEAKRVGRVSLLSVGGCALLLLGLGGDDVAPGIWALLGIACLVQARALSATQPTPSEVGVWRAFGRACGAVGVGLLAESVVVGAIQFGSLDDDWAGVGFALGILGFCSFLYQGIMHWNHNRADPSDLGDWLNGISGGLAGMAGGGLLLMAMDAPMAAWSQLQLLMWMCHVVALVVLFGSAVSVVFLGGLMRDRRLRALAAVLGAACTVQLVLGFTGDVAVVRTTVQVCWVLIVTTLAWASLQESVGFRVREKTSQSPVLGALFVMAVSIAVLAADGAVGATHMSTVLVATLATVGCGIRLLRLVASLADLAATQQEARTDPLTGIPNRRAITAAMSAAGAAGHGAALLIVDLDRFKDINDQHGHGVGDEVLRVVATRLLEATPAGAVLGRLGGDEFAVVGPGGDIAAAAELAAALVAACAVPVETSAGRMQTGASVGVAEMCAGHNPGGELLRRADAALYVAKRTGSGVSVFDTEVDQRARFDLDRVEELRVLLSPGASTKMREELVVHFQPQLRARTGQVVGAEALVRWRHPRLGLLYPDAFLDLAERHGLMMELTDTVLRKSVAEAVGWHRHGHSVRVAVNVSTSSLAHPDLLDLVGAVVDESGIDPSCLTLEITETTLMADPERGLQVTREIADRGIGISIDDYGTGYSSLSYLNDLPAGELKLDRAFTARVAFDQRTAAIVAGTIDLAHGLGLRVVAEGVEDEATLAVLKKFHCDETQGYLHARPMPAEHFLEWLKQQAFVTAGR